ncbi:hypothetical protein GCM10011502_25330 [Oceanisphaera marina]|uniref:AAA+ ATPase domain-containing protein n=1 Tax=Oceanisphaera marina TaxID=2017550 RepID=A0ABQ1IS21_9GAMM|nr:ATP-binding protein [Oceanisphaera marina]GGB51129.1 hypothetical protein GCM10011502_25330 [Oceanisphaera marina]
MPIQPPIADFLRKKKPSVSTALPVHPPLPLLWALRLLVMGGAAQVALTKRRHELDELLQTLAPDIEVSELSPTAVMSLLKTVLAKQESLQVSIPAPLCNNLAQLATSLGLSAVELDILAFLILLEQDNVLTQTVGMFHQPWMGIQQLVSLLAFALPYTRRQVAHALAPDMPLLACGLVQTERHGNGLELMRGLDDIMLYEQDGPHTLLTAFSIRNQTPSLTLNDFVHLQPFIDRLLRYLYRSARQPQPGVNVLIYGAPGTGKTELTRALSAQLQWCLHEVKFANNQGEALNGRERFARYQLCQQVLRNDAHSLVLFDEVEDVFNERISEGQKAWVNQLLENNPRPTFWLSNDVSNMDSAFIRRFDLVLAMPELTADVRLSIARRLLDKLNVSEPWLQQLAQQSQLEPAHVARAAKVVKKLGYRKAEKVEAAMEDLLANLYQALGYRWQRLNQPRTSSLFNPALCATDTPLTTMINGLQRSGMGRLCLFGPPGTGKTALAAHLAATLDKPLITKKASDLLDAYVGGTEKKLAAAFAEAKTSNGILLVDEADSLLANRAGAVRNWEVSQVNELLVQMEQFNGILVMATNFMTHLDMAALRRFDFKIRFTYFNAEQAWMYFNTVLGLAIKGGFYEQDVAHLHPAVSQLTQLTPGDFAAVARRHQVMGETISPNSLLAGLQQEHSLKTADQSKPIGFLANT